MKRLMTIVLAVLFLLSSLPVYAADTEIPISIVLPSLPEVPDVPTQITVGDDTYNLNMDIVKEKGYAVYGDSSSIKENQLKEGQYRYLGYDLNGNKFTNKDFPNDADSGRTDAERDWIKEPWDYIGSNGEFLERIKSKVNDNPDAAYWLDTLEIGGEWTGVKLVNFFNIQTAPGDYYPGQAVGWHKTGSGELYYKSFVIPPEMKLLLINGNIGVADSIEFTVNHYEQGTEDEVYQSECITNPETPQEVYAKSGIGLDGNEWICTVTSPQTVDITDGGKYNFYYTKKPEPPIEGEGQLILIKDPYVTANCKMPGRKNMPDTRGGTYPDGYPLYRGDTFKPSGTIKNPNNMDVFVEYTMKLKDKPNENFRQIKSTAGEGKIKKGESLTDSFTKYIDNNDRYGNVYVLTVEAKQRIIVPVPPQKPGPKPRKSDYVGSRRPLRSDYDSRQYCEV